MRPGLLGPPGRAQLGGRGDGGGAAGAVRQLGLQRGGALGGPGLQDPARHGPQGRCALPGADL